MTYLQLLRDSLNLDYEDNRTDYFNYKQVPYICTPAELEMESEVNGPMESYQLASDSIHTHLSELPFKYNCRLCNSELPHEDSGFHLMYSSTLLLDCNVDLWSEHVYGCCKSCTKKISRSEIDQDGNLM